MKPRTLNFLKRIVCCLLSIIVCSSIVGRQTDVIAAPTPIVATPDAVQMAQILGVRPQLDRILELGGNDSEEAIALRSQILQKVLIGFLEVRKASDKNWRELSYSFNIMRREQRKQDLIDQCFTLANFAQLSTLYTLEPYLRLNLYFKASAMCTQTGNGIGLLLPVLSIAQQKIATVGKTEPPAPLQEIIDGGPVNTGGLPEYVDKFFDSPAPGTTITRRQALFELWKSRYHVDAANENQLCSLRDSDRHKYRKTIRSLQTRILLLYSLYSYILDMDNSLLALLRYVKSPAGSQMNVEATESNLAALGLSPGAIHAAKLLNIKAEVAQLVALNKNGGNDSLARQKLEVLVLERVLTGALEVRAAADQVDAEINYAHDVVLAELLARRGKQLQQNFEMNFIQAGVFGSVAGGLFLTGYPKAGDMQFVISGGIGTLLSTQALLIMRGGKRPIDTPPNSLADVFDLDREQHFSPLITAFLNSPAVESHGAETRKAELEQYWKGHKVTTVNLDNSRTREKLAAMPSAKFDRIQIVTNRITMLHRLLYEVELFDTELLALLHATDSNNPPGVQNMVAEKGNPPSPAVEGSSLLHIQSLVSYLRSNPNGTYDPIIVSDRLFLVRRVFTTALDVRTDIDTLDGEISYESDVLDRMTRARDHTVALLNNANFYQLGILAIIIDGELGLSGNTRWVRASNMLNIVSGLSVGGLAGAALLAQHGGWRPLPSQLNMLGQTLGMSPPEDYRFSPEVWQFINAVPPDSKTGLTRVQRLREGWKQQRGIYPNMDKQSTREKMAAYGPHHHERLETIKLIKYRLNMLYDVQGLVGLFDTDLDDLLRSV
jgi:hypothetical protein